MSISIESIIDIESTCNWKAMNSILCNNAKNDNIDCNNLLYLLFTAWWVLADWGLFIKDDNADSKIEYDDLKKNFLGNIKQTEQELNTNDKYELVLGLAMSTIPIPFMNDEVNEKEYSEIIKAGEKYIKMAFEKNKNDCMFKYFRSDDKEKVGKKKKYIIKNEVNSIFAKGTLLNEYLTSIIEE